MGSQRPDLSGRRFFLFHPVGQSGHLNSDGRYGNYSRARSMVRVGGIHPILFIFVIIALIESWRISRQRSDTGPWKMILSRRGAGDPGGGLAGMVTSDYSLTLEWHPPLT